MTGRQEVSKANIARKLAGKANMTTAREGDINFKTLAEASLNGIIVFQDANIIYVNSATMAIVGYTKDELLGMDFLEIIHTDFRDLVRMHRFSKLLGEEVGQRVEIKVVGKNGRERWIDAFFSRIDYRGRPAVFATIVDITDRIRAEKEREITVDFLSIVNETRSTRDLIRGAATFLQQVSGCEAVGIRLREGDDYPYYEAQGFRSEFIRKENLLCTRDVHGHVLRCKDGFPMLDCMCGNVITGRFDTSKPFFTARGSFWTNSTTELIARTTEKDRLAKTRNVCNTEGYESFALIALRLGEERLGLLQLNDRRKDHFTLEQITMWERLADNLAVALAKFKAEEALNEAKMQAELYLDLMSHDINNIHQIALGYLEMAREMPGFRGRTEFLDKPVELLQRSAQLIKNVRKLQKLQEGVFLTQEVDVSAKLEDVHREFEAVSDKTITLNLNGFDRCIVRANELLYDVFSNLVGNAIKHTGKKANIVIDLMMVEEDGHRYCRVAVEDDGPGIPDNFKGKVFNRMLKGSDKVKGMGLGLYLVKSLVESYHGRVWVEDRVNGDYMQGARFVVLLPAVEASLR